MNAQKPDPPKETSKMAKRIGFRAFTLALGTSFAVGIVLGLLAQSGTHSRVSGWLVRAGERRAEALNRVIREHRISMDILSRVPSVSKDPVAKRSALAALRDAYAEFISVEMVPAAVYNELRPDPRNVRLSVPVGDGTERFVAHFASNSWELSFDEIAASESITRPTVTALIAPTGPISMGEVLPPSWSELRPVGFDGGKRMRWSDGREYLTSFVTVERVEGTDRPLAVVTGISIDEVTLIGAEARNNLTALGLAVGLLLGGVAWIAAGKATRNLRHTNERLERRVDERTKELALAERAFRGIFENAPLGLYQCDPEGRLLRANPALLKMLGPSDDLEALGGSEHRQKILQRIHENGEVHGVIVEIHLADGSRRFVSESVRAERRRDGTMSILEGAVLDVTAQRDLEDQLRRLGETDSLTGLLNRRGFESALTQARCPVAIIAMDVDRFKNFNDAYGHPAGDRALRAVADALRSSVRADDALARPGGEEFVAVLPETTREEAIRIAERLREAVAAINELEAPLTISAGIAMAEMPEQIGEAVLEADRALYRAKEAGRNCVIVHA